MNNVYGKNSNVYYICIYAFVLLFPFFKKTNTAQLAGAVEYTDCISAEG